VPAAVYSVEQYISDLRAIRNTGSATAETSFYPPLDRLFNAAGQTLKPSVLFSTQLRNQGAGMPDGGFFPQPPRSRRNTEPPLLHNPERGVVEIKGADYDLDALTAEQQTRRYLMQYGLVLITNLREFRLLENNPAGAPLTRERYVLAKTTNDLWYRPLDPKHTELFPDFLRRVMLYKVELTQPKEVAWLLASYAREARARAEDHELPAFHSVKAALEESLGMRFEGEKGEHFFRSTLVQTLFYGIFSAWVLWRYSPEGRVRDARFNWRLSDDFLRVPILRKLFREVSDRAHLNTIQLTEILELAGEALNRVQSTLFDVFQGEEAVAYFYEPFLEAFDPQLRKDLGVWYTPREIIHYMVERVDGLLRSELNEPLGLASPSVRILDPCCGTGAYLTAVLTRIHRTLLEQAGEDTALIPNALRKAALERIFGFEIMPAPFVIAHMEIARLLDDAGAALSEQQRPGIYLTNALTGWVPEVHPQSVLSEEFRREREDSEHVKQQGTILVILGNPPYNGYAGIAKIEEERDLTNAYREAIPGLPAPQGQGLNDLYIRFFRIAERRIVGDAHVSGNQGGRGIVCLISNNAWLDGLSHVSMRSRYIGTFQSLYIDNLNGDKYRTGKTTPEGLPDPSAFSTPQNREGIQVGTAISTLVRSTPTATHGRIFVRDLWGTGKLAQLERESRHEAEPTYSPLAPAPALGNPFAERTYSANYTSWPRMHEIFPVSFPGVKTSRDPLVIDIDRARLELRMQRYLGMTATDAQMAELIPSAMESTSQFDAPNARRILQEKGYRPWQIIPYAYRPFDMRWLYWEPETSLLDRARPEFIRQVVDTRFWFEIRQREASDRFCRGTVSRALSDQFGNGMSHFIPSKIFIDAGLYQTAENEQLNLSVAANEFANERGMDPADLFFHALAIMHTPEYRKQNSGALLSDWPRIPLPNTAELLVRSTSLGRGLAELFDPESSINRTGEWSFLAALKLPRNADLETALEITAGWGSRGQGSTVMPGRGKAVEHFWTPNEREKLAVLEASQALTPDSFFELLGDSAVDIYLNGDAFWSAVPINVWNYTLGGYQVLKKWLSYRELSLLDRPLSADEASYFAQVVRRITNILLLGPALDASYEAIAPTARALTPVR
jgi:hypothetical protein